MMMIFVPFTKYYYSDQIKDYVMDGTYTMHGTDEKCIIKFSWKNLTGINHLAEVGIEERTNNKMDLYGCTEVKLC
jgi:hypothetical protein